MTRPSDGGLDYRVLILAPIGRDGVLSEQLLGQASVACHVSHSAHELCEALREGAGAVMLTEEALADPGIDELAETLHTQPAWSDISLLLFAGDDRSQATLRTLRTLEVLRNVTLLDRPIRVTAVISTVRAALRGRRRQYELRDVLMALEAARGDAERARDQAERANRLKDEFLATLSHELRTPLNAILGWVTLLRDQRVEASRIPNALEIVARNAQSQAQLISDVLDVSRVITGRLRLHLQPIVVSRIVRDAMDTIRPAADAKEIELALHVDGDPPRLNGDAERLRQVFWNLFSNAVKFTPPGGRVDATIDRVDSQIRVRVADTGIGIAEEFLPHAFERFRQADQSFTRPHGGLGLGLAIVKHLVETHGGEVAVASGGAGLGATFTVQLPVGGAQLPAVSEAETDAAPGPARLLDDLPVLDGCRVLVVDDDPTTRELLATLLGERGARVATADSAAAALAWLDTETPAIVLADIGMPGQDGLSLMRAIRRRPAQQAGHVPAIALSAYARAEDRRAALAAGFDEYLTKPALPSDVVHAIARLLAAPQRRTPRVNGEAASRTGR
jgi:signal transduction histidine kinase/ActR/RegA family two-component response regulator